MGSRNLYISRFYIKVQFDTQTGSFFFCGYFDPHDCSCFVLIFRNARYLDSVCVNKKSMKTNK